MASRMPDVLKDGTSDAPGMVLNSVKLTIWISYYTWRVPGTEKHKGLDNTVMPWKMENIWRAVLPQGGVWVPPQLVWLRTIDS